MRVWSTGAAACCCRLALSDFHGRSFTFSDCLSGWSVRKACALPPHLYACLVRQLLVASALFQPQQLPHLTYHPTADATAAYNNTLPRSLPYFTLKVQFISRHASYYFPHSPKHGLISDSSIAAAISDNEDARSDLLSDDEQLPPKKPATKNSAVKPKPELNEHPEDDQVKDEADDDDDDEDNVDEYVVEKILKHAFDNGKLCLYEVKWMGYENPEDRTWEPEENL
jgi:hypothetical protein